MTERDPSEIIRALGGRTRMAILRLLRHHGPLGAVRLAEALGITTAAVSQHLSVLSKAGLVVGERDGYHVPYHLDQQCLRESLRDLCESCGCGLHDADVKSPRRRGENVAELKAYRKSLREELARIEDRINQLEEGGT